MEIVAVTSSSVTLQWRPPETSNGLITQYSILYNEIDITNFGNNMLMGTVKRLSPDTVYELQMKAHTRVGAGPPSQIIIATCKLFMLLYVIVICILIFVAYQY